MAQPFDITLKHLLESHPADCLRLVGLPTAAPIDVIDADLATVIAEADKVFRVRDRLPWLMQFELQVSYDANLPQRSGSCCAWARGLSARPMPPPRPRLQESSLASDWKR